MKNRIQNLVILIAMSLVTLSGCESQPQNTNDYSGCIPYEMVFAFPVGKPVPTNGREPIPPPSSAVINMPDNFDTALSMVYYKGSLWLFSRLAHADKSDYYGILRYDLSTGAWREYSFIDGAEVDSELPTWDLVVSPKNELWAVLGRQKRNEYASAFLMKYEDKYDRFKYVEYEGVYFQEQGKLIRDEVFSYQISYSFAPDGNLWLTDRYHLYEFDPENSQVQPRALAEDGSVFWNVQVAPDNTVWFWNIEKAYVMKYIPETKELQIIGEYNDWFAMDDFQKSPNSFLDSKGRLWYSDLGWLSLNEKDYKGEPVWYRIVRSPIFAGPYSADNTYLWGHPAVVFESSDGSIWFSELDTGLVKLNPENGKWCKIANHYSNLVTEDSDGNIWIYFLGKLYKYKMTG